MTTSASSSGSASTADESLFGRAASGPPIATAALIKAMIQSGKGISDVIFSPGRPAQVEQQGHLTPVSVAQLPILRPEDTARIAADLLAGNEQALGTLKDQGACDLSYSLPEQSRFRVNVFRQRGTYAIVMRVIPSKIPTLAELRLPLALADTASLKHGIVLVTVDRVVGTFEAGDQQAVRTRLAATFRYFVSQRLVPMKEGGRIAVLEILKSTMRTRDYLEKGDSEGKTLLDEMKDGELDGMQHFDGELEKLVRNGTVTYATAMLYATNAGNLRVQLADVPDENDLIIR